MIKIIRLFGDTSCECSKVVLFFEFNEKFLRPLLALGGGHVEWRTLRASTTYVCRSVSGNSSSSSNVASQANSIIASLHYPSSGAPILFVVAFWWHEAFRV